MVKLVAFDFDGTIADSVELCLSTFDELLKKMLGDKAPTREELFRQFGRNEEGILRQFFGPETGKAFAEFCRLHEKLHQTMCPNAFPGVKELLAALKARGLKLVLLTGRSEATAQISMRLLGLKGVFDAFWYGSAETSSKAAQMREMVAKFHLNNEEAVYVGDAVSDVTSSREAGLVCLSAAWAKSARINELSEVNPDLIFETVSGLQEWLEAHTLPQA